MPLLRNLCPQPACAVDASGITVSPQGDWARSTSVYAGLSRTTGLVGTTGPDITWARCPIDDETAYVYSFELYAPSVTQTFGILINYYSQPSGGTFLGNAGSSFPINLPAGTSRRFVLGPFTSPTNAASAAIKFNDTDPGGLQITAVRVAPSTGDLAADGAYMDGASPNASWDGTPGKSTSTQRAALDYVAGTLADAMTVTKSELGPVARDLTPYQGESWGIVASGSFTGSGTVSDGFLIMQLSHDTIRGRVRLNAFTFSPDVVAAVIERRGATEGRWTQIRGGTIPVVSGRMVYQADDYEYQSGVTTDYRIRGVSAAGQTIQQAITRREGAVEPAWIKFIPRPAWNRRVEFLRDPVTFERESRSAVYQVAGAELPVVVTDVHASRKFTLQLISHTLDDQRALDNVLRRGAACFLHVPITIPIPSVYASIGTYRTYRLAEHSVRWITEVDLTEVAAPPPSIVGARTTWQDVLDSYGTWQEVLAAKASWLELAD